MRLRSLVFWTLITCIFTLPYAVAFLKLEITLEIGLFLVLLTFGEVAIAAFIAPPHLFSDE